MKKLLNLDGFCGMQPFQTAQIFGGVAEGLQLTNVQSYVYSDTTPAYSMERQGYTSDEKQKCYTDGRYTSTNIYFCEDPIVKD